MVVTVLPATSDMLVWQERTALPSTCTVHAPHRPEPQPNFVPVSFRCSRTTQSSGVCGSTSTLAAFPLIVNPTGMSPSPMVLLLGTIITRTPRACSRLFATASTGSRPARELFAISTGGQRLYPGYGSSAALPHRLSPTPLGPLSAALSSP